MSEQNSKLMRTKVLSSLIAIAALVCACSRGEAPANSNSAALPSSLSQVSAVRLNFRYEADVPPPTEQTPSNTEERNAAVQSDFDQNRTAAQDTLDRTLTSPDKKYIAAVYHRVNDVGAEFRLDMYDANGVLVRKVTPDTMAIHFQDTILWAPDSSSIAFVATTRAGQDQGMQVPAGPNIQNPADSNSNEQPAPAQTEAPQAVPVLTFRTEQIYTCDADGSNLKPITQSEGKIYFYYVWSPDSTMLAALASTSPEWMSMQLQAQSKKEVFVPAGRPRLVEKNGRERLLDDAMTPTRPVWSPDSSKVAAAYDTQIRIYDANGVTPTQAAIPLRNQLLISSQAYDKQLEQQAAAQNTIANTEQPATPGTQPATTTLPDPSKLVSYNPIVMLEWPSDDILYFQTGYIKQFENPADNRSSYLRWHRLVFSPQPTGR
jgi:hypothetical protein